MITCVIIITGILTSFNPISAWVGLLLVHETQFLRGLGYCSSTNDYKVLILLYLDSIPEGEATNVAVYSMKADSWRIVDIPHYYYVDLLPGFYFNESLHWLTRDPVVVAFDVSREAFRRIELPASYNDAYYYDEFEGHQMEVLGGCLCLVLWPDESPRTKVWMMKKYGVRESWTEFMIADPGMSVGRQWYLSFEAEPVWKSHGRIVDVHGAILDYFQVENMYIETLVSPNQLTGKEHPGSSPTNKLFGVLSAFCRGTAILVDKLFSTSSPSPL